MPKGLHDLLVSPVLADLGDEPTYAERIAKKEPYATFVNWVRTAGDARVALGKAAEYFRRGYQAADDVSTLAGARSQAKSLLDQGNKYAMKVYAELPPGTNTILDIQTRVKVAEALKEAVSDLKSVNELLDIKLDLGGALSESFETVFVKYPSKILGAAGRGFWSEAWPFLAAAGVLTIGFVALRKKIMPGVFT
jgi:hypothetical protein